MSSNSKGGRRNRGARKSSPRKQDPEPKKGAPRRILNKLYIGDLSQSVKREDLEREFSRFGKIREVWLAHNPPGFAFVEFISTKDAADVVQAFDGKMLCGSKVRVEFAKANGPMSSKRSKQQDQPKASVSSSVSSLFSGRISPLLPLQIDRHSRPLIASSSTSSLHSIPPLLSLCGTSSPPRRGRDDLRYKAVDQRSLSLWQRSTSPVPLLLPAPRYHSRRSPLGRDRSPTAALRDLMPPPLLSPRDLHRAYALLPPLPLLPLSSRSSRSDGRVRSPARDRSTSPAYVRRVSPQAVLPSRTRLLGRTPPPLPRNRSSSLERRYSSPRLRGPMDSPTRLDRSPAPARRRSPPTSRSPLMDDRRSSNMAKCRQPSPGGVPPKYLARRAYSPSPPPGSRRRDRSSSLPRQFRSISRQPASTRERPSVSPRVGSRSPPNDWSRSQRRRSRSCVPPGSSRRLSSTSPSPKRFKHDTNRGRPVLPPSRSPSANGRDPPRPRSYMSPEKRRFGQLGPSSPPLSPAASKNSGRHQAKRRSSSVEYRRRPVSPSPKRYSSTRSRSPPIVRSPSPYADRRSPPSPRRWRRSPVGNFRPNSPPVSRRTPPRMYRQTPPEILTSPPRSGYLRRRTPPSMLRSPVRSSRSPSIRRRSKQRSPRQSSPPSPKMNPRSFARSPSSRISNCYGSSHLPARKCSPPSRRSSPLTKRGESPPCSRRPSSRGNSPSYARRSPPSNSLASRRGRNSRLSSSPSRPVQMIPRRSRSTSSRRSPFPRRGSPNRVPPPHMDRRRRSVSPQRRRSVSPQRSPVHSRRSSRSSDRRASSPVVKSNPQMLYKRGSPYSPSPRRGSPLYRNVGRESRRQSRGRNSPCPSMGRRSLSRHRSRSRSGVRSFSPKTNSRRDWSPPRRPPSALRGQGSWEQTSGYKSPKRKSLSPPPPPPPPRTPSSSPSRQHHRRHKSKKSRA